jgi:hypothetical protein
MRFRAEHLRPHGWRPPLRPFTSPTGAAVRPSTSRSRTGPAGGSSCRSGIRTRRLTHCGGTSPQSLADEVVAIQRLREPPRPVTLAKGQQTLYEVTLSAVPSRAWRAAFLRPPPALTTARLTPELGRLELEDGRITFRTTPPQLHQWLRRIDRWIAYANSVVAE